MIGEFVVVLLLGGASAALTLLLNELNYRSLRVPRDWPENARASWPVLKSAQHHICLVPVLIFVLSDIEIGGALFRGFASAIAITSSLLASWFLYHKFHSKLSFRQWCHVSLVNLLLLALAYGPLLAAFALMVRGASESAWIALALAIVIRLFLILHGWIWLAQKLRLLSAAPPHLRTIVFALCNDLKVSLREVYVLKSVFANALAMPITRSVVFTDKSLEILNEDETIAVTRHEATHLRESKAFLLLRVANSFLLYPVVPIIALARRYGQFWLPAGLVIIWLLFIGFRRLSRKLEFKADQSESNNPVESAAMASALIKLYQFNRVPAVIGARSLTHPDLYDRLIALGQTPEYPRPKKPSSYCWTSMAMWVLLVAFICWRAVSR